jgi:MacB-like periplasmic core domain
VIAIPGQAPSRQTFVVTMKLSSRTLSTRPILEDNVKSSAPLAVAGVLGSILIAGCVPTLLGRGFLPEEYGSGSGQVVMVSHRLWQQRFRGDPRIIGTTMRLNGQGFTVIGIMPPTFDVPSGVDIWVPKAG